MAANDVILRVCSNTFTVTQFSNSEGADRQKLEEFFVKYYNCSVLATVT